MTSDTASRETPFAAPSQQAKDELASKSKTAYGALIAVGVLTLVAVLLGLLVFGGDTAKRRVYVAARDLAIGERIGRDDVKLDLVDAATPNITADPADLAGRVTRVPISTGAPIATNLLTSVTIPDGTVAYTLPLQGQALSVSRGDKVDVLSTQASASGDTWSSWIATGLPVIYTTTAKDATSSVVVAVAPQTAQAIEFARLLAPSGLAVVPSAAPTEPERVSAPTRLPTLATITQLVAQRSADAAKLLAGAQDLSPAAAQQFLATSRALPCLPGQVKGVHDAKGKPLVAYTNPDSDDYAAAKANVVCFATEQAAAAAGYTHITR